MTVFTVDFVRDIIPEMFEVLIDPSNVLHRPLMQINPKGFNGKFGRVSTDFYRNRWSRPKLVNSTDGLYGVSRIIHEGSVSAKVRIDRQYSSKNNDIIFEDVYHVSIMVSDASLHVPGVTARFGQFHFGTRKMKFDPSRNSFRDFFLKEVVDEFNNQGMIITTEWNERCKELADFHDSLARFK